MKRQFFEEPNYLVETQLPFDRDSFAQVVKEAFLFEFNCTKQTQIAELIDVDPSQIAHLFKSPSRIEMRSIRRIFNVIQDPRHRQRILRAWLKATVATDIDKKHTFAPEETPTMETVKKIHRLVRNLEIEVAARWSYKLAENAEDHTVRELLLDAAYSTRIRMNQLGFAMRVARDIAIHAQHDDPMRLGAAHLYRAQIFLNYPDCRPSDLEPIIRRVVPLVECSCPGARPPLYYIATKSRLKLFALEAQTTFIERSVLQVQKAELRTMRRRLLAIPPTTGRHGNAYSRNLLAARLSNLLEETFVAKEYLDAAFKVGGPKVANVAERCAIVQAQIMKAHASPEEIRKYLSALAKHCIETADLYHGFHVGRELAFIESSRFP